MKSVLLSILTFFYVSLFAQKPLESIPMELYGDHIFIQVSVDDSEPLDFIFDSGDGLTVIDLDIAKKLELNLDHKQSTTSAGGKITGALIKHNKVEIDGLLMDSNIKVYATSLNHLEISIGRNIDGIIGYDILHNYTVRLNYDDGLFELFENGKGPQSGKKIEFDLNNSIPVIDATVTLNNDEKLPGKFYVNTGAGTTMDFNTPFVNANDIINKTGDHYSYLVKGIEEKESLHYEGKVKSFEFGPFKIEGMPVGISQAKYGIQNDKDISGIIGNRLLNRFNLTIDYKNKRFYFDPNSRFENEYRVNASGLDIQLNSDRSAVLIHQVYEDSPAMKAGININDVLVSVNGESALELGIAKIKDILSEPGQEVELTILQGGKKNTIIIKLVSLI